MLECLTCVCATHDFNTLEISIGDGGVALSMKRVGFSMFLLFRFVFRFGFRSIWSCLRAIAKGCVFRRVDAYVFNRGVSDGACATKNRPRGEGGVMCAMRKTQIVQVAGIPY